MGSNGITIPLLPPSCTTFRQNENCCYFNQLIGTAYSQQCLQPVKELELAKTSFTTFNKSEKEFSEHLRIGIISRHFRRHSVGWCSRDIIREWSKLTPHLYLYVTGGSDFDDIAEDFSQMTDSFFDFSSQSNLSLLEKLRADSLDILIDMDSLMSPSHALILYHSPAKVVLSWLGCEPPYISQENYYLCDRYTHPESVQSHYQEKLIRMPDFAMAIAGFSSKDIDRESLRRDLGLVPKSIVYLSVASGQKINLDSIRSHISILKQVPDSVLLHKGFCDVEVVRSLYERECMKAGIDPERCQFLPFQKSEEEHRVVYQIADVALDTYPYNGGTHNLECLWFNLPLVTLCGEQAVSRMGYSFLTAVGISEGIAKNWEEYIDWGVKLGTNLDLRLQLQQKLRQSKQKETLSPIWNPKKFALDAYTLFQTLEKEFVQKALLPIVNPPISEAAKLKFDEGKKQVLEENLDQAIICFREAIRLQPDYVAAYNQLGNALQTLGQSDEAIACYQKVLEINPNMAAAHYNLGSIWQIQEKYEEAIAAYQRAIKLKPDFSLAYQNLGKLYGKQHQLKAAENCLHQALKLQPQNPEIHQELGNIIQQAGRLEDALICFRNAIKLNPQFSGAYYSLGCLLISKGQLDAAKQCLEKVLQTPLDQLSLDSPLVYSSLGFILESQNKFPEALSAYNQSLQLNPEATEIFYQWEHLRLTLCDWDDFDVRMQILTERIQKHLEIPHSAKLAPLSLNSFAVPIALHTTVNRHWSQTITESIAELKAHCGFTARRFNREKIRLGYLSADFRSHAVGSLIADIFQYHDRALFEVYGYSLADTSDETTKIIEKGCDCFVNIAALSVEAGARRIYADEIDVLIDLGGYTTSSRPEILALQPAPIQMQYLGYPDTMGAEFVQYILSDRQIIPPELAHHYTEQVIELPQTFIASPVEITADVPSRSALGLPEKGFVYCCFNRTDKFDPHLFAAWMRILQQVPDSVLWLSDTSPEITQTLKTTAQAQGIEPERLVFLPKLPLIDFIAHLQRADLFLDTWNYNAGATAIAALQSGLPILTYPGETFASRMGASICHTVGLDDFICESPQNYEEKAVYWGNHPQELQTIRDNLLQNKKELPLFQPKQWVNSLESVLRTLWQQFTTDSSSSITSISTRKINPSEVIFNHLNQPTPASLIDYDYLTFPSLQKRWSIKPQRGELVGILATINGENIGLAIAEKLPNNQAELLSFFVSENYRNQGIGTQLLQQLQQTITQQAIAVLQVDYKVTAVTDQCLEPIFQKLGWQPPQCTFVLAQTVTEKIAQAPWLTKYPLSENFTLFPWAELTEGDRQQLSQLDYPVALSPVADPERLEPLNSLGLRYQNRLIGWIVTHRVAPNTIRYSTLFVESPFRAKARGIALLSQAIQRQINSSVNHYTFAVATENG